MPEEKKPKKPKPPPPKPPAAVSTACVILRHAVAAVVGIGAPPSVGPLQPLFSREAPRLTGKFAVQLGKKVGDGKVEATDEMETDILDAVEKAANRMIQENHALAVGLVSKQDITIDGVLDASFGKSAPDAQIHVSLVTVSGNAKAVALQSLPYASTGMLERIVLIRDGTFGSAVNGGKKAKKAEISLYFEAFVKEGATEADLTDIDLKETLLLSSELCEEGQVILKKQEEQERTAQEATTAEAEPTPETEMVVNAFEVKGKIDYSKLVDKFGSTLISNELMQEIHAETVGKGRVPSLHRFLRRGMFFSHRDLHLLLQQVRKGVPMYLYTGRGPSSESMHLGHLIPFLFTQWLQKAFDVPLVIQMTDDEKYIFKGTYEDEVGDNLNHFAQLTMENARDIIACGFDYSKTFLFSDLEYVGSMYPNVVRIWKAVTTNTVNGIFGFDGSSNIGKIAFPAIQAAPSFASSFPKVLEADRTSDRLCLIPCAIDQDPYFRMTRDVAHKLVHKKHALGGKPALIHSKFFPPLQGAEGKMSSSDQNSAIFLTDTPEEIERKIKEHAFSGGQDTMKKQKELGADLEVDVSYQWLRFFLEDDEELQKIGDDYSKGEGEYWSTGKVKERLVDVLKKIVAEHQTRRALVTDEEVRKWMTERSIVS